MARRRTTADKTPWHGSTTSTSSSKTKKSPKKNSEPSSQTKYFVLLGFVVVLTVIFYVGKSISVRNEETSYSAHSAKSAGSSNSSKSSGSSNSSKSAGSSNSTKSAGSSRSTKSAGSSKSTKSAGSTKKTKSAGSSKSTKSAGSTKKTKSAGSSKSTKSVGSTKKTKSAGSSKSTKSAGRTKKTKSAGSSKPSKSAGSSKSNKATGSSKSAESTGSSKPTKSAGGSKSTKSTGSSKSTKSAETGGWRLADNKTLELYDPGICNIERRWFHELSVGEFEENYRQKKPLIISFKNGAYDWTKPKMWTVSSLKEMYGQWSVYSGNAVEIVRNSGSGYVDTSFTEYVDRLINQKDEINEPLYLFDRDFYQDSGLPKTLNLPSYLQPKPDDPEESIFFLGSSATGVSFHRHTETWNGVVFGRKRWFLYDIKKTPPGGHWPAFTQLDWLEKIYPYLSDEDKPQECVQEAGELLYLPENTYHGTLNLGDTVAVALQKKLYHTTEGKLIDKEKDLDSKMREENSPEKKEELLRKRKTNIQKLLPLLPDSAEVHSCAGNTYKEAGYLQKAKEHLELAIELDKNFVIAMIDLAKVESQLGNLEAAEYWYKLAEEKSPKLWDVYSYQGEFLFDNHRYSEAFTKFKKGFEISPQQKTFKEYMDLCRPLIGTHEDRSRIKINDEL